MSITISQHIINICNNDYKFFFSKPNVVGIGLGYKYVKNINTCELALHVLVSKKVSSLCLSNNALIPACYKGIKSDVIETGSFLGGGSLNNCSYSSSIYPIFNSNINTLSPNTPLTNRIRPIQPGYCISTPPIPNYHIGTFGYIATDNTQETLTYCILSTNDVLANLNNAPLGSPIIQTGWSFGGRDPQDTVATLLRFERLIFNSKIPNSLGEFNTVNAAVAKQQNIGQVNLINPFIPNIGIPRGLTTPSVGQKLQWTGCINGLSRGTITSINANIIVDYGTAGYAYFKDVILSTGKSGLGDFGALAVDNNIKAVGLLFAKSLNTNIICKIDNVLQTLDVSLLTL